MQKSYYGTRIDMHVTKRYIFRIRYFTLWFVCKTAPSISTLFDKWKKKKKLQTDKYKEEKKNGFKYIKSLSETFRSKYHPNNITSYTEFSRLYLHTYQNYSLQDLMPVLKLTSEYPKRFYSRACDGPKSFWIYIRIHNLLKHILQIDNEILKFRGKIS